MRMRAMVLVGVVVGLASVGCFSTAPYDAAHRQRVAVIDTRYAADTWREQQHHAALVAALDQRRADLDASDPDMLRTLDDQATQLARRHADARRALARTHDRELAASRAHRAADIDLARAARRDRLRAAALAARVPGIRPLATPLAFAAPHRPAASAAPRGEPTGSPTTSTVEPRCPR